MSAVRITAHRRAIYQISGIASPCLGCGGFRTLNTRALRAASPRVADIAFTFDIDGVLLREKRPLPGATDALRLLQSKQIPFIFLTNGGGKSEQLKRDEVSHSLGIDLETSLFIQSHTPFSRYDHYKDKTVLVVGGEYDNCKNTALMYGFNNVVTPSDIYNQYPDIWPFSKPLQDYHRHAGASSRPKIVIDPSHPEKSTRIDAIFVFNDPRDWGLDLTVVIDCLLSSQGILGTISPKNGREGLPNHGYQQDGQPKLYFSNSDLWWPASYPLSRLGQGAFREALEGVWAATTGGTSKGVTLQKTLIGKPHQATYEFAEQLLSELRAKQLQGHEDQGIAPFRKIYMVGDNPASDIQGANNFRSPLGIEWKSILVKSGVYRGGKPEPEPTVIKDGVLEAVRWAAADAGYDALESEMVELTHDHAPQSRSIRRQDTAKAS